MTKKQFKPITSMITHGTRLIDTTNGLQCTFIGKSANKFVQEIIVEYGSRISYVDPSIVVIAPLCLIGGEPVYPGDTVYNISDGNDGVVLGNQGLENHKVLVKYHHDNGKISGIDLVCDINDLTLYKPKTKYVRWVNIYSSFKENKSSFVTMYDTKEAADEHANDKRITCLPVEWEE